MDFLANFSKVAGDFSFLFIFIAIALVAGFFFGRTKLLSIMIDVYIARVLVSIIPDGWISSVAFSDVIIFVIVFLFLLFTDYRLFDLHIPARASGFIWRVGGMGILVTGMIVSSLLSYLPKAVVLQYVSESLYSYFVSDIAQMFWMITPLLVLAFINRRYRD